MADSPSSSPAVQAVPDAASGVPRPVRRLVRLAWVAAGLGVLHTVITAVVSDSDWRGLVAWSAGVIVVGAGLIVVLALQVRARRAAARVPLAVIAVTGVIGALAEALANVFATATLMNLLVGLDTPALPRMVGISIAVVLMNVAGAAVLVAIAADAARAGTVDWCRREAP